MTPTLIHADEVRRATKGRHTGATRLDGQAADDCYGAAVAETVICSSGYRRRGRYSGAGLGRRVVFESGANTQCGCGHYRYRVRRNLLGASGHEAGGSRAAFCVRVFGAQTTPQGFVSSDDPVLREIADVLFGRRELAVTLQWLVFVLANSSLSRDTGYLMPNI